MATRNNAAVTQVSLDYVPRGPFRAFHQRHQKRAVLVCHRRAGKTVACIHDLVFRALATKKPNSSYGYIAPLKNQAKTIAWDYLVRAVKPFGKLVKINNQELAVTLPTGARIRLFGADDPDSFRGMYFDGVILDEFADMRPKLYTEVIQPALMDRDGWAVFIGTPKGHNSFYKIREQARKDQEKYFYLELKASESGFLSPQALEDARAEMTQAEYDQEFECSFEAAIQGSFYAEQISQLEKKGHVIDVPWIPGIDVHTAWDLGFSDATTIWFFQIVAGEVRIIDYYEVARTPLAAIVEYLKDLPYEYGYFYLPHDATHDSLQTGKSILEDLWNAGFDVRSVPKLRVANGINAVRKVLPLCWFDLDKTFKGLEALKLYSKTWSQQLGMFTEQPRHDQHSHAADAFRYLALVIREQELSTEVREAAPPTAKDLNEVLLAPQSKYEVPKIYYIPPVSLTPVRTTTRV